jgi:hypothetical protein
MARGSSKALCKGPKVLSFVLWAAWEGEGAKWFNTLH